MLLREFGVFPIIHVVHDQNMNKVVFLRIGEKTHSPDAECFTDPHDGWEALRGYLQSPQVIEKEARIFARRVYTKDTTINFRDMKSLHTWGITKDRTIEMIRWIWGDRGLSHPVHTIYFDMLCDRIPTAYHLTYYGLDLWQSYLRTINVRSDLSSIKLKKVLEDGVRRRRKLTLKSPRWPLVDEYMPRAEAEEAFAKLDQLIYFELRPEDRGVEVLLRYEKFLKLTGRLP